MEDERAFDLTEAIKKQHELQQEANDLMRTLIDALQATAQELLELRGRLNKSER